ncbi:hypothetical protein AMAG_15553 [Allomyces macrogynus ATCC 38327]|uniref:Uncharacterized protein n=1 Tax=Allomyces macrogynus (strain ATCC 38327) TaxID=578462 RepID=A0A0L0T9R2_ALLM3|nr:hypothetical protein AMAG_15553 [Allomyces macrogynus ATCC 38327]|eukprot:KNE71314.1 hypothetical protein AMAG_15553 [Allomyces macrogynus ATCC 38327]
MKTTTTMAQKEMASARDADANCSDPDMTTSAINPAAEPNSQHHPQYLIWIDFDQTLTADDSIAHLAALPTASATQLAAAAPAVPWSSLVDAYLADYNACLRFQHPTANSSTEAAAKSRRDCTIQAVCSRILQLRPAEAQSVARLENARYFAGLDPRDVQAHGAEVVLHNGAREVLGRWVGMGREVVICSVNWSVDLIRGALDVDGLQVVCNDLEVDEVEGRTTGRILGGVLDGTDKLRRFEERLVEKGDEGVAVFIGDSLNDVPCMLRADIGILFAPSDPVKPSLLKLFDECGITLVDLATTTCSVDRVVHLAEAPCRLYRARSWAEIDRFLARA